MNIIDLISICPYFITLVTILTEPEEDPAEAEKLVPYHPQVVSH
jgi:hypothetical protein